MPLAALCGDNGAGKTNILEACSLLMPGRGFRNAAPAEILPHDDTSTLWVVRATVRRSDMVHEIVTAYDGGKQRIVKCDGDTLRSQQSLHDVSHILWFLPTMSHLLSEGQTVRRKYLDRIVYGFDRDHASRVQSYEHYMRERRRVLMMGQHNAVWLDSLEQRMAEISVAIAYARMDALSRLNYGITHVDDAFPRATLALKGDAETLLSQQLSALDAEHMLRDQLAYGRARDGENGRCGTGAHRTQFEVGYSDKAMLAEHCSTGEQKALLLTMLLAQIYAHQTWYQQLPVLLLDDIAAHLDAHRRMILFNILRDAGMQVIATSTDRQHFHGIDECQVISVSG